MLPDNTSKAKLLDLHIMMQKLSKRAKLDPKITEKVKDLVKQLKFNSVLHDRHDLKVTPENKKKILNRATRLIRKLERQFQELGSQNAELRRQLKENTTDRKDMQYNLRELQDAADFARGRHPVQEALRSIKEENEKYEGL